MKGNNSVLWTIGIVVVSAAILFGILLTRSAPADSEARQNLPVVADDHVKGTATSTVVLIEYLDFECGSCGAYFPIVKKLGEEYGDRVTFVVRHFPLPGHRNAAPAAYAAEAAGRQGKFWEMHDLLFARQKEWGEKMNPTPEVFEAYAQELGLNMDTYRADVTSSQVSDRVKRDYEQGQEAGVRGTPTFFLNGQLVRPTSYESLKALLDAELAAPGA